MDIEKFIRDSAARGLSRSATAAALEMRFPKFLAMLEAMPPLEWAKPGYSLDCRLANEAQRGNFTALQKENLTKIHARRREKQLHTVRGVTGTIPELMQHFGVVVNHSTVSRRRRLGMTTEQALFTPAIPLAARRAKKIAPPAAPARARAPLSAWERVDLEAPDTAPQCM
jgi:hypothetical protein